MGSQQYTDDMAMGCDYDVPCPNHKGRWVEPKKSADSQCAEFGGVD